MPLNCTIKLVTMENFMLCEYLPHFKNLKNLNKFNMFDYLKFLVTPVIWTPSQRAPCVVAVMNKFTWTAEVLWRERDGMATL